MQWNGNKTITIDPPKRPKKCTGTRFGAILGANKWTTPFEAWCAITRTYEKPFEDTIYTIAGKTIEPKQAEYMKNKYFWKSFISPADIYGEDYFKKTYGDFFSDVSIFGGMWDYLFADKDGKPNTVMEMKTTKRAEDWQDDIPEYYALQAALYAYLLGVDDVIMVCTILEDADYQNPEAFVVTPQNTFERPFKVSERYPNMDKIISKVKSWWKEHVESGVSPVYNEKLDAEILRALRNSNLSPDTDLSALIAEAEALKDKIDKANATVSKEEKRYKVVTDLIKQASISQFKDGDKTVTIPGSTYEWVTSMNMKDPGYNMKAMQYDGIDIEKYHGTPEPSYRLTPKKKKED